MQIIIVYIMFSINFHHHHYHDKGREEKKVLNVTVIIAIIIIYFVFISTLMTREKRCIGETLCICDDSEQSSRKREKRGIGEL